MARTAKVSRPGGTRLRNVVARVEESVESRLWPLPVFAIVVAVALGIVMPRIDLAIDPGLPGSVDSAVFNGGADTARAVLSSIAGSLITATALTFSLTVVALQLASSQASPRVLRLFARDRSVHATLAVFLGTFAYSITVLRSVRSATPDIPEFVPRVSVTIAFVLTLVSVIMLVFFLAHLATQLRVENMIKDIHAETDRTIDLVGDTYASERAYGLRIRIPDEKQTVTASSSGFVTSRDRAGLAAFATEHDIVIEEVGRVGDSFVAGTPLAYWWTTDAAGEESDPDTIEGGIRRANAIGYERTSSQDIDFGVQQIVDIAVRALSPGVNDPTTAVNALGHLSAIITRTIGLHPLPAGIADDDGNLRIVTVARRPAEVISGALSPIRHYGASDPFVVIRFLQVISDVLYTCPGDEVRDALAEQLTGLEQQLRGDTSDPVAVSALLARVDAVADDVRAAAPAEG